MRLCANCDQPIPIGRGSKNHNGMPHPQTRYCSDECRKVSGNEVHKASQRLLPAGTDRFRAVGLSGAAAEAVVTADLLLRGHQVYKPVTATARNDLVVEIDGVLYRVQVKSVRRQKRSGNLRNKHAWRLDSRHYDILANVVLAEYLVTYEPSLEGASKGAAA